MTELEIMKHAKNYIDMLSGGIDPISGERVESDNFINNTRISRCLTYVSDVLQKVIDNGGEVGRKVVVGLSAFTITDKQASQIEITEEPVGIADFTKRINSVLDEGVKPISAVSIASWLVQNGYLTENIYNGKKKRVVAPGGTSVGIITVDGVSKAGIAYQKNVYTASAQRFIVENINRIALDIASEKMS